MKKNLLFAFTFLFFLPAIYSKNINFQVVQNNPGFDTVFAVSNLFEQALSDFFFESGHIVSNSPVFIKEDSKSASAELKRALADTLLGGMDVLVRLEIKYDEKTANSAGALLPNSVKSVSWQNYNPKTGKIISDGSIFPEKVDASNNNEAELYKFASSVAAKVSSTLKSLK